jgi:hypothetical protein
MLAGRGQWEGEGDQGGGGRPQMGQLALSMGPEKMGIRSHVQGANIPRKGFHSIQKVHACPEC